MSFHQKMSILLFTHERFPLSRGRLLVTLFLLASVASLNIVVLVFEYVMAGVVTLLVCLLTSSQRMLNAEQ